MRGSHSPHGDFARVHLLGADQRLTCVRQPRSSIVCIALPHAACCGWSVRPLSLVVMSEGAAPASRAEQPRGERKPRTADQLSQDAADRALMRQVMAGDQAAFASFYRRFSPGVFSMIYEILRDQKEAEDVLQEAFVQMWKKAATYDPERSSVFTWAIMISRNRAIDRVRARQRRARTIEAATAEAAASPEDYASQADELIGHSEERTRIRAALRHLPEAQRHAIDLAFFRGLTQAEISTQLDTPLGTVKARIRRGLLALRDALGSQSDD
jgi:RNA polymerase sigma-70 factor, ECF subfamily